jgi:uncharacterized protein
MDVTYLLEGYTFVWDAMKAEVNLKKHGVSFEQACEVFFDDFCTMYPDSDQSEQRWIIVGHSYAAHPVRPLYVVAAEMGGDAWRVISARLTTATERRSYEEDANTD